MAGSRAAKMRRHYKAAAIKQEKRLRKIDHTVALADPNVASHSALRL